MLRYVGKIFPAEVVLAGFLVGGSVPGQWYVARASGAAPGTTYGGLGPQRLHLMSFVSELKPKGMIVLLADYATPSMNEE